MSKRTRPKFLLAVEVTFLCLSFSLLPVGSGWAKQCAEAEIKANIAKLNNTDAWISTIEALRKCGSPSVAALIAALQDKNERTRIRAASALGSLGTDAASAAPALVAALQDKNERVRSSSAYALESVGAKPALVVPALTVALQDQDAIVRDNAASALESIGAQAASAVPNLTKLLQDKDKGVRSSAASALGSMGAQAASAVPALKVALQDQDQKVRQSAARALSRIPVGSQVQGTQWFQHKWLLAAVIYFVSLPSLWFVILWLRPLWLMRINNALIPYTDFTLPGRRIKVSLRFLIFVGFFHNHPRVVDAWVAANIDSVQESKNFEPQTLPVPHVQQDAKAIAWECLKQTYRPECVKRDRILEVLASLDSNDDPEARLQMLEKDLGIIETIGSDRSEIRFTEDLLAEYLAALYVVELYRDREAKWQIFWEQIDAIPDKKPIQGFLLAIHDCRLASSSVTSPAPPA